MTLGITTATLDARLQGLVSFLDTGAGRARLRLYSGARPALGAAPGGTLLHEVSMQKPCATVADGELHLLQDGDPLILATGVAVWARLITANGDTSLDLDVTDQAGNGEVKLPSTQLYAGGTTALALGKLV